MGGGDDPEGAGDGDLAPAALEALLTTDHPRKLAAAQWAREHLPVTDAFDPKRWAAAAEFGVQGMLVPAALGGSGLSVVDALLTFEGLGLGTDDQGTVFALSAQVFAMQSALLMAGSPDQLARWVPDLCSGAAIGSFAMSEPDAGSDTAAITTTATELDDGTFRIDGVKSWVTLGSVCDVMVVFAVTDPAAGRWGHTAFLVEMDRPGIDRGAPIAKMGLGSCPFTTVTFDDCRVGPDAVLGSVGAGGAIFADAVNAERAFLYAAQLGASERAMEVSIERARTRTQFGRPIGSFQAVSHRIADMKLHHEASRLLIYKAGALRDRGGDVTMAAALAKLQTSESGVSTALDAIQILGAEGYTTDAQVERFLRDAVGGLSYSGTSDIQRNIVASLLRTDRPRRRRP
ncbi:MAG: acyl-CoA dehydrogenase [Ilumatobacter sp.]|nr:acyl-CoA dehydrogenase [Ilumatobacter sp.]